MGHDRTLSYRLLGLYRYSHTQTHHVRSERYALMPEITYRLTPDTSLSPQAIQQNDPSDGQHSGLPADAAINTRHNGQRISRRFVNGDPTQDQLYRKQQIFGCSFNHRCNEHWSPQQNFRYLRSQVNMQQVYGYAWISPGRPELLRHYSDADERLRAHTIDTRLLGQFDTGAVSHTLLAGVDDQQRRNSGGWPSGLAEPINPFHPQYGAPGVEILGITPVSRRLRQTGVYLQDQLVWRHWHLLLGLRYDRAQVRNGENEAQAARINQGKLTKRPGLLYLFDNGLAPYFSPSVFSGPDGRL